MTSSAVPARAFYARAGFILAASGLAFGPSVPAQAADVSAQRLVVAHYYSWYDMDAWSAGITSDLPVQLYVSADAAAMAEHVDQARAAGIDAFNVAWLGPRNPTDWNLGTMLPLAASRGISLAVGFETDSPFLGSREAVVSGLRYAMDTHMSQPGYLRYEGRPVIFFWRLEAIPADGSGSPAEAWRSVRDEVDPNREMLWIGEGDRFEFLQVFDGIYPYSIAWSRNVLGTLNSYGARTRQQAAALGTRKLWVATVMPGYDDLLTGRSGALRRDRASGAYYDETWQAATASGADWIIITSWNEWVEGSQIEPSRSYGNAYLELTHGWAQSWKGVAAGPLEPDPAADGEATAELAENP